MEEVTIIYQDEAMVIVNKPAGMTVTSEGVIAGLTLENWVNHHFPESVVLKRHGIVHRIDKGTSGLVAIALQQQSLDNLQRQFKNREVIKVYTALVGGNCSRVGEVKAPIGRFTGSFGKWRVKPEGKMAETSFRLEQKYRYLGKIYSLLEVRLKTGRTHQIRVHMSYLGWPLVGDRTYGGEMVAGIQRPFLHAGYLSLHHPESGERKEFSTLLAGDLVTVLKQFDAIS